MNKLGKLKEFLIDIIRLCEIVISEWDGGIRDGAIMVLIID